MYIIPTQYLNLASIEERVDQSVGPHIEKIGSVALGCFALLHIQFAVPFLAAGIGALICAGATFLSEKYIRSSCQSDSSWFSLQKVNFNQLKKFILTVAAVQAVSGVVFTILKIPPPQMVAQLILAKNWKIIGLAALIAPITEEILFRGFLKERLEDAASLCSRFIYPISDKTQKRIANLGQAILFGAAHILKVQIFAANTLIFLATGCLGLVLSDAKDQDLSLLTPICMHAAINTSVCLRLLTFGH